MRAHAEELAPGPLVASSNFDVQLVAAPQRLRILTYNLHGPTAPRVAEIVELLANHPELSEASILALQEVNRASRRSGNQDMAALIASRLHMHFAYATEQYYRIGGGERGLALFSRYPIDDVERIALPVSGPGGRRRIALAATIDLGSQRLRVVNVHLETRITPQSRAQQIRAVLAHSASTSDLPLIVLGDFNTFTRRHTRTMFDLMQEAGLDTPLPGDVATFQKLFVVRWALDWIWLREVSPVTAHVESRIKASDHRPLWIDIDLGSTPGSREETALIPQR